MITLPKVIKFIEDLSKDEELINKLIQQEIERKISKGFYNETESWDRSTKNMIHTFTKAPIEHNFQQTLYLLKSVENTLLPQPMCKHMF